MLSDNAIDNLVQPIVDRQESINMYVILKMADRLKAVRELSRRDVEKLRTLAVTGADVREINKELAKQSGLQERDIKNLIRTVGADTYKDTKPFYDYRHKSYIPFEKNRKMQRIVSGIANQTRDTYKNISNSSATGFVIRDRDNSIRTHFYKIEDTYRRIIDEAIQASLTGLVSSDTAINWAIKQLLNSGIRRISWDSGYTQRLDTAVRRNVLEGVKLVKQAINDEAGKDFDADGKELSAHMNSAPDHEPFQGHIFTNAEWNKIQTCNDFEDINGQKFSGVDRIIGVWNCKHVATSIVIAKHKPKYTPEQLQKFIDDNAEGYTAPDGKHMTLYQCTQKQRRMETRIRYAKEEQIAMKELGNKTGKILARQKVIRFTNDYKAFSKACGLPTKMKRCGVSGYTAY